MFGELIFRFNKYAQFTLSVLILFLFIGLAQVNITAYVHATITSKFIVFAYSCLVLLGVSILYVFSFKNINLSISKLDLALLILISYISLNRYVLQGDFGFSIRYMELLGLSFLYMVLRNISVKNYVCFLLAIVISGIIQAIYGNLQLLGYYASNHSGFNMTGSFFNPGPYAGFLASIWSIALGMYLFKDKIITEVQSQINHNSVFTKSLISILFEYIPVLGVISILLVLPASQSRAAWLAMFIGSSFLLEIRYRFIKKFINGIGKLKKIVLIIASITILSAGLFGIYHFKKGSSDGRLLIWNITTKIIKDNPIFGVGFDRFKSNYMNYQASYFVNNAETKEAILADNTYYAFNETFQFVSENGFLGFLLFFFIGYIIYTVKVSTENKYHLSIAKVSLLTIGVFSCFSYPMQILPIKIIIIFLLAFVASMEINKTKLYLQNKNLLGLLKAVVLIIGIIGANYGFSKTQKLEQGFKTWNNALSTYQYGNYEGAIQEYKAAYPIFKSEGEFLMNYGKALSIEKQHKQAIQILVQAKKQLNTTIIETALGDSYKALKQYKKAEIAYQHAANMIPSRFYPNYLLAKLYDESGQNSKAILKAKEILKKEVKIPSTAIKEIRAEMVKLIDKAANK